MPDDEKRSALGAIRLRKFIEVAVEDKLSFTLFRAALADISATGARLISSQFLMKGQRYTITMKRQPMLVLKAEVRWVRAFEKETFQVGLQFIEVAGDDRERLISFIDFEKQRFPTV